MRRWMASFFERWLFERLYRRREARADKDGAFRHRVAGLDTLWRAATFVESAVDHEERDGLFDVPHPPAWTLARRRANGSDAARLAQAARSEERRVGKAGRSRGAAGQCKNKHARTS